jgi:hypothetical protein
MLVNWTPCESAVGSSCGVLLIDAVSFASSRGYQLHIELTNLYSMTSVLILMVYGKLLLK